MEAKRVFFWGGGVTFFMNIINNIADKHKLKHT